MLRLASISTSCFVVCQIAIINSLELLNQTLADTACWREIYKKHHCQFRFRVYLKCTRRFWKPPPKAAERGDDGMNDLFVSNIIRTNDAPAWFISEHLVDAPLPVAA